MEASTGIEPVYTDLQSGGDSRFLTVFCAAKPQNIPKTYRECVAAEVLCIHLQVNCPPVVLTTLDFC